MTIERIYFEGHNFVLSLIYGKLTEAELGQHVLAMNEEYKDKTAVNELADCRFLTDVSELTAQSVAFSASMEKGVSRVCGSKGAIVVASNTVFGMARAYAAVAQQARIDSRVFRSMDEAIKWLEIEPLQEKIAAHSAGLAMKA